MFAMAIDIAVRYSDTMAMDWKNLISEITASGMTQAELATKAGLVQSAISDLVTGKTTEPRFSTGQKLVAIRNELKRKRKSVEA